MALNQTDIGIIRELVFEGTSEIRGTWLQFTKGNLLADISIAAIAILALWLGLSEKRLDGWQSRFKMSFLDVYKTLLGHRKKIEQKSGVAVDENVSDSEIEPFLKTYDEKVNYIDGLLGFYPEAREDLKEAFDELFLFLNETKFVQKNLATSIKDMVEGIFLREEQEIIPINRTIIIIKLSIMFFAIILVAGVIIQSASLL